MLNSITLNKNDEEIVKSFQQGNIMDSEMKHVIQEGLSKMRIDNQMANFKGYRIEGILPEDISNEICFFSNMPGENDDELIMEVDHHNSDHSGINLSSKEAEEHEREHNEGCAMKQQKNFSSKNKKSP